MARAIGVCHLYLVACVLLSVLSFACGQCIAGHYADSTTVQTVRVQFLTCQTFLMATYSKTNNRYAGFPVYKHNSFSFFLWKNPNQPRFMISMTVGSPTANVQVLWNGNSPASSIGGQEWCSSNSPASWSARTNIFQVESTTVNCLSCPVDSTSAAGSTGITACTCIDGYTGTTACTACDAGTYKTSATVCTPCVAGKYSSSVGANNVNTCLDCQTHSNSLAGSGCAACDLSCGQCIAGEYATSAPSIASVTLQSLICQASLNDVYSPYSDHTSAGFPVYKHITKNMFLWKNPNHPRFMISSSVNSSLSNAQVFWDGTYPASNIQGQEWCNVFPPARWISRTNMLQVASTTVNCLSCPTNFTSSAGSIGIAGCTCIDGYTGTTACTACEAGTYKTSATVCTPCAAGKYSSSVGANNVDTCLECQTHSDSLAGSDNSTDCRCNSGYSGTLLCVVCPIGTYRSRVV